MSGHAKPSDRSAAYTGLIFGAVAIFAMVFGIVTYTNHHYDQKEAAHEGAATPK